MKDTPQRKKVAAQKSNLKSRLTALTMKPSGNAKRPAGVNLDPSHEWPADSRLAQVRDRLKGKTAHAVRQSKGKERPALTGKAASLANLKRGRAGLRPKGPTLTKPTDATTYVLLRASGVPPNEAVAYFARGDERLSAKQWFALGEEWEQSALTKAAWVDFHGGEWQTLDHEKRTEVALLHHLAQCAYILYTTDITDPLVPMGKVNYAKTTILAKIAIDKNSGGDDKFGQFLQQLATNANASAPMVWKGHTDHAEKPRVPDGEAARARPEDHLRADDPRIGDEDSEPDRDPAPPVYRRRQSTH